MLVETAMHLCWKFSNAINSQIAPDLVDCAVCLPERQRRGGAGPLASRGRRPIQPVPGPKEVLPFFVRIIALKLAEDA